MNKIYKVVWSKARNCYVVASEFAKSHQTGTKRVKSTAAAVGMAVCLLTSGGMAFATTGEPTVDTNHNYVWSNAGMGTGAENNVVVGPGSKVNDSKKSIAVGKDATTQDNAEDAIAIGTDATASGTSTVAIGTNASAANENSSAYGNNAKASNGSTAIGANANAANSVFGTIVISAYDKEHPNTTASSTGNRGITIGVGGTSNGHDSIAIGTDANANGALNVAIGFGAKVNGDQHKGGVALGAYSEVSEMKDPGHPNTTIGYKPGMSSSSYYDPIGYNSSLTDSVWNATNGAVSVGRLDLNDPSKTITRQITNVAAGTWLTDAVNVAQLKALEAKMTETGNIKSDLHLINGTETISGEGGQNNEIKGYKVDANGKLTLKVEDVTHTTDGYDVNIDLSALKNSGGWTAQTNGTDVKPNKDGKINFKNGDNIFVTSKEGEITIAATGLAKNDLSNITDKGKTEITNLAKAADIHVKNGSYAVDENGNVIMTYVDGNDKDVADKNIKVTGIASKNAVDALDDSAVKYDKDENGKVNKNSVTLGGTQYENKVGGTTITNVAYSNGTGSDAVNVDYLNDHAVKTDLSNITNEGKTTITNIAKVADIHVKDGSYTVDENGNVTMQYEDGNGNIIEDKKLTIKGITSTNANDAAVVYVDNDKTKSLHSTNYGAVGTGSIALGKGANAVDDSIAIGDGASVVGGTRGNSGIALGVKAHAGYKGTSLGNNAISGREGAVVIGDSVKSQGLYSTVIGTDSVLNTNNTPAILGINVQGAAATIMGAKNTVDNKNGKAYSGVANNVMGSANTIEASNGVTIQGSGNTVTNAYKDMDIDPIKDGVPILSGDYSKLAKKDSGAVAVIGGANTISNQISSTVIGFGNTVVGTNSTGVFTAGSHNTLTHVSNSLIMGDNNTLENRTNVISLGNENKVEADDAVAIGNGSTVTAEGGVAIGTNSVADRVVKEGAVGAFAPDTITKAEKSTWTATAGAVSVGDTNKDITRQITNVAAGSEDTDAVNVAQLKKVKETITGDVSNKTFGLADDKGNAVTKTLDNTVQVKGANGITSTVKDGALEIGLGNDITVGKDGAAGSIGLVGKDGKDGLTTTTIKTEYGPAGVDGKDGITRIVYETKDGDKTIKHEVATLDDGLKFKGDINDAASVKLNKQVNVVGGITDANKLSNNNIGVVTGTDDAGNATLTVKLSKDLTGLNSVTTNNAYVTNVDTSDDKSVTNVAYVNQQIAGATLSAGDGISITDKKIKVKLKDGEENLIVDKTGLSMNKNLQGIQSITGTGTGTGLGKISFDGGNVKINNTIFSSDGRIQKVTKGTADTDAVNVKQLNDAISKGDTDTHVKAGEYTVGNIKDSTGKSSQGVSIDIVDKSGASQGKVTIKDVAKASDLGDVSNLNNDLQNTDESGKHTSVVEAVNKVDNKVNKVDKNVGDLNYVEGNKGNYVTNGESVTASIGKLDAALKSTTEAAGKHTIVSAGNNIDVTNTAKEGEAANYQVSLKDDITLGNDKTHVSIKGTEGTIEATGNIKAGSFSTGTITINKDTSNTIDGLANKTWDATNTDQYKDSGKAATEAQLQQAMGGTVQYDRDSKGAVTNNITLNKGGDSVTITNVADGKVEKGSTDAVNGGQLYETNQAIANNATNISSLSHSISNLDNRVNKVGAGAAALAALHPLDFDPDAKWDFAAGYGNYRGTNAAAIGAYYRPNEDTMFSVGGTFGNGENMVNAGVSFKLGAGSSHVSTSRVAMAKEIKELREHMAAQDKLIAQLTGPVNALTGSHIQADLNTLFPDVPKNHWAYDYVTKLAQEGYIEGYPDGNFKGDAMMTRYEFAAVIYRAMMNGAARDAKLGGDENLNKLLKEFEPELEYIRIDTIAKDKAGNPTIQRARTVKANTNK